MALRREYCKSGRHLMAETRMPKRNGCRECRNIKQRAWRAANSSSRMQSMDGHRRRKFGLSPADFAQMISAQANLCAICQRVPRSRHGLAVDHDHVTGAVRDLLCHHCNSLLGYASDDIEVLRRAIAYLIRHRVAVA